MVCQLLKSLLIIVEKKQAAAHTKNPPPHTPGCTSLQPLPHLPLRPCPQAFPIVFAVAGSLVRGLGSGFPKQQEKGKNGGKKTNEEGEEKRDR